MTLYEKEVQIFGNTREYYSNEQEAWSHMKTISIPVWKLDTIRNTKYPSKMYLSINGVLECEIMKIFTEIYNHSEKFPIKSVYGYVWREIVGGESRSHHSYGTAIDINPNENYMIKNGTIIAGSLYQPGVNQYSMSSNGSVITTFKKHNWLWGGDWYSSKDYMHLTYLGG